MGIECLSAPSQPDAIQNLNPAQRHMLLKPVSDDDETVKKREREGKLGKDRPWKEKAEIRCTLLLYTFIVGPASESEKKNRDGRSHGILELLEN